MRDGRPAEMEGWCRRGKADGFYDASALHYGTIAMRTHLDGTNNVEDKALRDQLFEILGGNETS